MSVKRVNVDESVIEEALELTVGGKTCMIPSVSVGYVMDLQQASESGSGTAATETLIKMLSPLGVPRDAVLLLSYRKALGAAREIAEHFTSLPGTATPPGAEGTPNSNGPTPSSPSSTVPDVPTQ